MKKFLVLMLVLGMASLANAGLLISVGGVIDPPDSEITLEPSQYVMLDIHGDGLTPSPADMWLIVEGPGTSSGGQVVYPGTLSSIDTYVAGDGSDIVEWLQGSGYANATTTQYIALADGSIPPAALQGLLVDMIEFHCEGPEDVLITLVSGDLATVFDTQVIHQPEPMTMALLGLGGLFLRRRK